MASGLSGLPYLSLARQRAKEVATVSQGGGGTAGVQNCSDAGVGRRYAAAAPILVRCGVTAWPDGFCCCWAEIDISSQTDAKHVLPSFTSCNDRPVLEYERKYVTS